MTYRFEFELPRSAAAVKVTGPGPRLLALSWVVLMLAACHTVAPRRGAESGLLQQQQRREQQLAACRDWTVQGRLGLSDGKQGGSGSFTWVQQGDHYDFSMRKPITGGLVFRLQGSPAGARLETEQGRVLSDPDVNTLLRQTLGWSVPLRELQAWVLALRAEGSPAQIQFQADGLPASLSQDGWQIDYPSWEQQHQPALPRQVFASQAPYKVRLSLESWQFGPAASACPR